MIIGTGVDIVEVARIKKSLEKYSSKFEEKIFTAEEILYCRARAEPGIHFAARFAAKEAVMKCLGTGIEISFKDIEVTNLKTGKPLVTLFGKGREIAEQLAIKTIHISLSHDNSYAIAQAIAES
jgi:holo-[acyl-carrier protein] synthase